MGTTGTTNESTETVGTVAKDVAAGMSLNALLARLGWRSERRTERESGAHGKHIYDAHGSYRGLLTAHETWTLLCCVGAVSS